MILVGNIYADNVSQFMWKHQPHLIHRKGTNMHMHKHDEVKYISALELALFTTKKPCISAKYCILQQTSTLTGQLLSS